MIWKVIKSVPQRECAFKCFWVLEGIWNPCLEQFFFLKKKANQNYNYIMKKIKRKDRETVLLYGQN